MTTRDHLVLGCLTIALVWAINGLIRSIQRPVPEKAAMKSEERFAGMIGGDTVEVEVVVEHESPSSEVSSVTDSLGTQYSKLVQVDLGVPVPVKPRVKPVGKSPGTTVTLIAVFERPAPPGKRSVFVMGSFSMDDENPFFVDRHLTGEQIDALVKAKYGERNWIAGH